MAVSLQVIYPTSDDTSFDYDYYNSSHMEIVDKHMGPYLQSTLVIKGLAGGPNIPPGSYVVATLLFADQTAFEAAIAASEPVMADIPNFTNCQPQILIGEVIG